MHIRIIAVGKIAKNSSEHSLIEEYKGRLPWSLEIIEIMPVNEGETKQIKTLETKKILSHIREGSLLVVCDERGQNLTSHQFHELLVSGREKQGKVDFVIGGAYGLDQEQLPARASKIAFGKQTIAHKLLRILLVEQIYRAYTIGTNHPYHK